MCDPGMRRISAISAFHPVSRDVAAVRRAQGAHTVTLAHIVAIVCVTPLAYGALAHAKAWVAVAGLRVTASALHLDCLYHRDPLGFSRS